MKLINNLCTYIISPQNVCKIAIAYRTPEKNAHFRTSHTCECVRMFVMSAATHILRNMFKIDIILNFSLKSYVMTLVRVSDHRWRCCRNKIF